MSTYSNVIGFQHPNQIISFHPTRNSQGFYKKDFLKNWAESKAPAPESLRATTQKRHRNSCFL